LNRGRTRPSRPAGTGSGRGHRCPPALGPRQSTDPAGQRLTLKSHLAKSNYHHRGTAGRGDVLHHREPLAPLGVRDGSHDLRPHRSKHNLAEGVGVEQQGTPAPASQTRRSAAALFTSGSATPGAMPTATKPKRSPTRLAPEAKMVASVGKRRRRAMKCDIYHGAHARRRNAVHASGRWGFSGIAAPPLLRSARPSIPREVPRGTTGAGSSIQNAQRAASIVAKSVGLQCTSTRRVIRCSPGLGVRSLVRAAGTNDPKGR
jgi:hypothetical protein